MGRFRINKKRKAAAEGDSGRKTAATLPGSAHAGATAPKESVRSPAKSRDEIRRILPKHPTSGKPACIELYES